MERFLRQPRIFEVTPRIRGTVNYWVPRGGAHWGKAPVEAGGPGFRAAPGLGKTVVVADARATFSTMDPADLETVIRASIATKQRLLESCVPQIGALCDRAIQCLSAGGKLLFCGNGGSSCDASHAAGELVGWFENHDRPGYAAIALGHEVPTITAVANDSEFEMIFARQLLAIGKPEDMLIGISTSSGSKNVVRAIEAAREVGMAVGVLVSERSGPMVEMADVAVRVPSDNTARIQESHLLCVHMLCAAIEDAL